MADTLRAFIALELDKTICDELAVLQTKLKPCGADVKWVEPENIHLTLKFLGEVDKDKIDGIKSALAATAAGISPFNISLSQIGAFPNLNSPRVVWVGIEEKNAGALPLLAQEIENQMEKLGFPKETRPFFAHLTLGRLRHCEGAKSPKGTKRPKQSPSIKEIASSFAFGSGLAMTVSAVTLFQSTLTPSGPIYTALYEAKLKTI